MGDVRSFRMSGRQPAWLFEASARGAGEQAKGGPVILPATPRFGETAAGGPRLAAKRTSGACLRLIPEKAQGHSDVPDTQHRRSGLELRRQEGGPSLDVDSNSYSRTGKNGSSGRVVTRISPAELGDERRLDAGTTHGAHPRAPLPHGRERTTATRRTDVRAKEEVRLLEMLPITSRRSSRRKPGPRADLKTCPALQDAAPSQQLPRSLDPGFRRDERNKASPQGEPMSRHEEILAACERAVAKSHKAAKHGDEAASLDWMATALEGLVRLAKDTGHIPEDYRPRPRPLGLKDRPR